MRYSISITSSEGKIGQAHRAGDLVIGQSVEGAIHALDAPAESEMTGGDAFENGLVKRGGFELSRVASSSSSFR